MSNLLERLKEETRNLHIQTEELLYSDSLRSGTLSLDQYRHLLLIHALFHQALEQAIDQHPLFFDAYAPDTRRKTPWLQQDLAQLGLTIPKPTSNPFGDWSPIELVGAAYVSEGSMLGGKTVWHYLHQSPSLQPVLANARFYQGYGAETGQRWRDFGSFAGQRRAEGPDQVIAGAEKAFLAYHDLFKQTQAEALSQPEATNAP